MVKNTKIQMPVEAYPSHTLGLSIIHPRCRMERKDSVDLVSGKNTETILRAGCMPSMGQMIPHSMTMGKKLPIAIYVADRSLSTEQETTKPTKNDDEYVIHLFRHYS